MCTRTVEAVIVPLKRESEGENDEVKLKQSLQNVDVVGN